jgi:hypothetical protein
LQRAVDKIKPAARAGRAARLTGFSNFPLLFGVLLLAVFGFVVMALWNWLTPPIFGLRTITSLFYGEAELHSHRVTYSNPGSSL